MRVLKHKGYGVKLHVDVLAVNQYLGWYYGDREAIPDATWVAPSGKPVVFTELGAGANAARSTRLPWRLTGRVMPTWIVDRVTGLGVGAIVGGTTSQPAGPRRLLPGSVCHTLVTL